MWPGSLGMRTRAGLGMSLSGLITGLFAPAGSSGAITDVPADSQGSASNAQRVARSMPEAVICV